MVDFRTGRTSEFVALCFLLASFPCKATHTKHYDICGETNGKRLYLELGEKGTFTAKNATIIFSQPFDPAGVRNKTSKFHYCSMEIVTCPSCILSLRFSSMNLSQTFQSTRTPSRCPCSFVSIFEPPYEQRSEKTFCGQGHVKPEYRSQTRNIAISFAYCDFHEDAFTLEYIIERNRIFINGSPNRDQTENDVIKSPFFPAFYPRDLITEHVISCNMELAQHANCYIRLVYTDFQLGTMSFVEFYDTNGQRLDVTSGALFRPPVIVSSGPSLLIRFHGNSGTGPGYKAFYNMMVVDKANADDTISTDCGGYVENYGGGITMMNMVDQGLRTYDCVWLIRPPKNYIIKSHLYLKVVSYMDMTPKPELIIHEGLTSDTPIVEQVVYPVIASRQSEQREHIVPVTVGFYVRLKAKFSSKSRLAIVYAAFSYKDCFSGSDFICSNHRCIPLQLNCDGFDHCGDNSDEPATCYRDWELEPVDRRWYSHTPNYYFPKIDRYPDLKTASMVFFISSLGLIALISALILLLYRMGSRARQQREIQNQLQTISDLLDGGLAENGTMDEPPVYEAPPDYDEVIKIGFDDILAPKRKVRRSTRKSRSRSLSIKRTSSSKRKGDSSAIPERSQSRDVNQRMLQPLAITHSMGPSTSQAHTSSNIPESPPPVYVKHLSSSLGTIQSFHGSGSRSPSPRAAQCKAGFKSWLHIHKLEIAQAIFRNSKKNSSMLRRCRSQDDMLAIPNIPTNYDSDPMPVSANLETEPMHESASDSDLCNLRMKCERDKLFDRSFTDYKAMKYYFENLFTRAKYPRKNYKPVVCSCKGACGCNLNADNSLELNDGRLSRCQTASQSLGIRDARQRRVKSADETFLAKSKCYLASIRIWKSTDDTSDE